MTIANIAEQIKTLKSKWQANVVTGRASEESILKAHLGSATSFVAVSSQMENWFTQVGKVAGPRVSKGLPKTLIQSTLRTLSTLHRSVDQAANGLEWMFQNTSFGTALIMVDNLISELSKDSSREQTQILEAAQIRLSADLKALQDGGELANQFKSNWPVLQEQIARIVDTNDAIAEKVEEISTIATGAKSSVEDQANEAVTAISQERANVSEAKSEFDSALVQAQSNMNDAGDLKSTASKLVAEISKQSQDAARGLADANDALIKATNQQNATRDRLTLALRDAQMEGLAGSFTRMTEKTEMSIQREQRRFDQSLTYLASIGLFVDADRKLSHL